MVYCIWKSYKFYDDPFFIFKALKDERFSFFLDSSLNSNLLGRYSFLGFDPFYILSSTKKNSFEQLRSMLNQYKISIKKPFSPFLAGAVGFLSYDFGFNLERKLSKIREDDLNIPDFLWSFYSSLIIIDHLDLKLYIFSSGIPERRYSLAKLLAEENLKKIERILSKINFSQSEKKPERKSANLARIKSNFTKDDYVQAIKKAKEYIRKGDIYQVNLSQRFQSQSVYSASQIYENLRKISPSFFSAYLDCGDFQIICSSPEEFLKLEENLVSTRPMKGTRPRSKIKTIDKEMKEELLQSKKDMAELIMIVDLERNDLGKVCDYHSIRVESLRNLEEYATVFQTTSTIKGRLHRKKDRIDLLRACFPGGSITGCPKLRAMEIIEELELNRRSIYTGSLGYLSFSGNMNLNILIRTMLKKKDKVYFGVGGGIVADSKPVEEYEETLVKAEAMMQAINTLSRM